MYKEKISAQDITDYLASKASVSKRAAEEFLKAFIASVEEALLAGESVKIKNFGTFKLQWNEPRKSVNVQTGEEILLAGYSKVTFSPEIILRDLVNEPFAHLDPVELDANPIEITGEDLPIEDEVEALEPLRIFTEQATEIRSLLSEIQALSVNSKPTLSEEDNEDSNFEYEENADDAELQDVAADEEIAFSNDEPVIQENVDKVEIAPFNDELSIPEINEPVSVIESTPIIEENALLENEETVLNTEIRPGIEENSLLEPKEAVSNVELTPVIESKLLPETEPVKEVTVIPINEANQLPETDFPDFKPELEILSTLINTIQEKKPDNAEDAVIKLIEDPIAEPIGIPASVYTPNPFLQDVPALKKRKTWFWIPLTLVALVGGGVGLYFYSSPVNEWVNTIYSGLLSPKPVIIQAPKAIVVPLKTVVADTSEVEESVDSLQILFDNPRAYTDFIASERIVAGSRLARMSERYYGNSHFWVYIYEANKERIPDPDIISPGTLIRIPRLDPRLIDASNPRCIQKASELHDLYVDKRD